LYDAILFASVRPQCSPTLWGEKDGRRRHFAQQLGEDG